MIRCNLAILLAEKGLKITDISRETGISRTTLTSLSNNYSKGVQFDTINALCNYLDTTPDKLITYIPVDISILEIKSKPTDERNLSIKVKMNKNHFNYYTYLDATCIYNSSETFNLDLEELKILHDIDISVGIDHYLESDWDQSEIENTIEKLPEVFKNDFKNQLIDCIIKHYGFDVSQENYKCTFRWSFMPF